MSLFPLWHIAHETDWVDAQESGEYRVSTRGKSLDEEGFIHCSYPHQTAMVARNFYADDPEPLVILELDREALERRGTRVRVEAVDGQNFPHLFGPIYPESVVLTRPLEFAEDGSVMVGNPTELKTSLEDDLKDVLASMAAEPSAHDPA